MKVKFNDDWFFTEQPLLETFDYKQVQESQIRWQQVDVPHDWLISDVHNLYRSSEGWYRKNFEWHPKDETVTLRFDSVYQDSEVYVNGVLAGNWRYGYTAFEVDLSHLLKDENEILVRVRNQSPNTRWYSGAGIYRNCWLIQRPNTFIETDGIYCHSEKIRQDEWELTIQTNLSLSEANIEGELSHYLIKGEEENLLSKTTNNLSSTSDIKVKVVSPEIWTLDNPNLYMLKTILVTADGVDTHVTKIGFRTILFDVKKGFLLNDKPVKFKGVCLHHDLGALGAAFNRTAQKRNLKLMKEMGANAIRTAHNPAAEELLELADEMGFLVQSELTDVWKHKKTTFDYARYFEANVSKDVKSWISRDRNHPSVVMWSIGNEIYDTHGRDDGQATLTYLADLVQQFDPHKNAKITICSNYLLWEKTQEAADNLKIVGYNYGEQLYAQHHEKYPDWLIYGSETLATVASRGIYHFPLEQSVLADDDFQCSSLGNSATSWGAKSIEWALTNDRDTPYSMGQFLWTGVDYIGEPTPYHTKNAYFGQVDTAGFPKDTFYMIQAMWTDYKEKPMIHILPYWDFSENDEIDVRVVTNAPKMQLYLNDKLIAERDIDLYQGETYIQNFKIPYQKGKLVAIALDNQGHILQEKIIRSFSDTSGFSLTASQSTLTARSEDLIFIEIQAKDIQGTDVSNANNRVFVDVQGAGRLIGLDNGDSTDFDEYKGTSKRLFSGKLLAIIAATDQVGDIKITVSSKGMPDSLLFLKAINGDTEQGLANAYEQNLPSKYEPEIPIRKIELHNSSKLERLTSNQEPLKIKAITYPSNADVQEIFWRLTDVKGIETQIAKMVKLSNTEIEITPIANGTFYLRAGVKNQGEKLQLYTQKSFQIENMVELVLNPYQPISGGLVSRSNVALTNGNERGIATLRGETSYVVFDKVNFGDFGSNELMLSLFPLENNPFEIEIWQGYPYEETSEQISVVTYDKGSIWNTYQEQLFVLPKRFRGLQTISFIFKQKVHMKAFKFNLLNKALSELNITDYDLIYGDSYQEHKDIITEIGNNVTIQFKDMDFGENGVNKLQIQGRSIGRNNTIQLSYQENGNIQKTFIEFLETTDLAWQEFTIPKLFGKQEIAFVFLPGSDFDFKSFRFY